MNKNNYDKLLPVRLWLMYAVMSEFYNLSYSKNFKFLFCILQDDLCLRFFAPSDLAVYILRGEGTCFSEILE